MHPANYTYGRVQTYQTGHEKVNYQISANELTALGHPLEKPPSGSTMKRKVDVKYKKEGTHKSTE